MIEFLDLFQLYIIKKLHARKIMLYTIKDTTFDQQFFFLFTKNISNMLCYNGDSRPISEKAWERLGNKIIDTYKSLNVMSSIFMGSCNTLGK